MAASSFFEVAVSPLKKVEKVEEEDDDAAVLILAPFTKPPRLIFKDVKLGTTVKKPITIRNPSDVAVQVELVKLPAPDKGLVFSATRLVLQPNSEEGIEVTWTPLKEGSWRFAVGVKTSCTLKMDIIINCTSVRKKPVQKKGPQRRWAPSLPTKPKKNRSPKYQSPKLGLKIEKKSPLSSVTPLARRRQTFLLSRSKLSPYLPDASARRQSGIQNFPSPLVQVSTDSKETWERAMSCSQRKLPQERRVQQEDFLTPVKSPLPRFKLGGACTIGRRNHSSRQPNSETPDINAVLDTFTFSPIVEPPSVNLCFNKVIPPETQDSLQTKLPFNETPPALRRVTFDVFPPTSEIPVNEKKVITKGLSNIPEISVETSIGDSEVSCDSLDECKTHNISSETYAVNKSPCNLQDLHDLLPDKIKFSPEVVSHNSQIFSTRTSETFHTTNYCTTMNINVDRYISPVVGSSNISPVKLGNENPITGEFNLFKDADIGNAFSQFAECQSTVHVGSSTSSAQTRKPDFKFSPPHRYNTEISPPHSSFQSNLFHQPLSRIEHTAREFGASLSDKFSFENEKHRPDIFRLNDSSLSQADKWCEVSSWQPTKLSPLDLSCKKHLLPQSVLSNVAEDFSSVSDIVEATKVEDHKLLHRSSALQSGEVETFTTRNFVRSLNFDNNDFSSDENAKPLNSRLNEFSSDENAKPLNSRLNEFSSDENTKPVNSRLNEFSSRHLTTADSSSANSKLNYERYAPPSSTSPAKSPELLKDVFSQVLRGEFENFKSSSSKVGTFSPQRKGLRDISHLTNLDHHSNILSETPTNFTSDKPLSFNKTVENSDILSETQKKISSEKTFSFKEIEQDPDMVRTAKVTPIVRLDFSPPKKSVKEEKSSPVRFRTPRTITKGRALRTDSSACGRKRKSRALPVSHLILSAKKACKPEKSVRYYDPDGFLSNITNPKHSIATSLVNPFLTSAVYYDGDWYDLRIKEFVKWLNYLLTPPAQLSSSDHLPKVDVAELWSRSCKEEVAPAPSREIVSSLYHINHRLDSLRKAAYTLFQSLHVAQVLSKVLIHIDKGILAVRDDRNIHLDVGLKQSVLKLLLCYNPLWLRIGLETIYGKTVPMESNSDAVSLVSFIANYFLSDPYLVQRYSVKGVLHSFKPGFGAAMKKFILKKFLFLVYFLDYAKEKKLIGHDPCLFCKDAMYKESREILLAFARDLLSGIGDITKHLRNVGYLVKHKQTYLHEYNYAVTSLESDLRDGVRLVRVMEIILQRPDLSAKLRTPAISKLQKVHNVQVALEALTEAGYTLEGNIAAKDIVEGHKEKTLSLLWQIIYKFQAPHFSAAATKIQVWWRKNALKVHINQRIRMRKILKAKTDACVIIQKHWRAFIQKKKYQRARSVIIGMQRRWRNIQLTRRVRSEYLAKRETIIKLQSVCRGYILRKNIQTCREMAAAYFIQTWYRRKLALRRISAILAAYEIYREETKQRINCAIKIQAWYRRMMEARKLAAISSLYTKYCEETKERQSAAVKIQNWYRRMVAARTLIAIGYIHEKYCEETKMNCAASKIQIWYRKTIEARRLETICRLYRNYCEETKVKNCAASKIQTWYRRTIEARKLETICRLYENYCEETKLRICAASKIQTWYCRTIEARKLETICRLYTSYCEEIKMENCAATKIQTWYRRRIEARKLETICSLYKNYCEQTKIKNLTASKIQIWYRKTIKARKLETICRLYKNYCEETKAMICAATKIQIWYRRTIEARRLEKICRLYRNYCEETKMKNFAVSKIQIWYCRMIEARRLETICRLYKNYCEETKMSICAASKIQTWYRRTIEARKVERICRLYKNYCEEMKAKNCAATIIQIWYRRMIKARRLETICRFYKNYCQETKMKNCAASKIQIWYRRMIKARRLETICRLYKNYCEETKMKKCAATKIQTWYRRTIEARKVERICRLYKNYCEEMKAKNCAATIIQIWYRRTIEARKLETICRLYKNYCEETKMRICAASKMQTWYRRTIGARRLETICRLYRNYCQETKMKNSAASKIQIWYCRTIEARKLETICRLYENYCEVTKTNNSAASKIQIWYRRTIEARKVETICRLYKNYCEEMKAKNCAATKIQIWYCRMIKARRLETICRLYENYCEETKTKNSAATKIQIWYRRTIEARKVETICRLYKNYCEEMKAKNCAATKIQIWYCRMIKARRLETICRLYENYCEETKTKNSAATKIQIWYRRTIEARKVETICRLYKNYCEEMKAKNCAATKIQIWYRRMIKARKLEAICRLYEKYCEETKLKICAATKIQIWYRRTIEARKLETICRLYENYCEEIKMNKFAASKIQIWYRRMIEARKLETICRLYKNYCEETKTKNSAATKIQIWYRRTIKTRKLETICRLYKNYCEETKAKNCAATIIQIWYRRMIEARKIQTICRLYVNYCEETKTKNCAATIIQIWYRRTTEARKLETICRLYENYCEETKAKNCAATKIQTWYRRSIKARELETICRLYEIYCEETKTKNCAATKIHIWYRRRIKARELETICRLYENYCEEIKMKKFAASKIQIWYRRTTEARKLETICRLYENYCEEIKTKNCAATKIQIWYRRTTEARKLETVCRLYEKYCEETKLKICAASKIQIWYRRMIKARKLETIFRLYSNYCEEIKGKNYAASKIQIWYRRTIQARKLETICRLYENYCEETKMKNCAASKIQIWYRRTIEARRLEAICTLYENYCDETKMKNCAASKIQIWYRRNMKARRLLAVYVIYSDYCERTKRRHHAAAKIQVWYRRILMERKLNAIRNIFEDYYVEINRRKRAAARIQTWYRKMVYCRRLNMIVVLYKSYLNDVREKKMNQMKMLTYYNDPCYINAAVVIQKHFRRFRQQKKYKTVLKSTICIQRHWRGMQLTRDCRKHFLKIRTSAIKLQAWWRGYLVRRNRGCTVQENTKQLGCDHSLRKRYTTVLNNWMIANSFGELLVFVQVIDTVTRLSRELSEEFSANHLNMLFLTIGHCNRSIPASHVLEFATSILVNLVKHEDSMQNVWKVDLVKVLLRLMSGWCGKSSTIFCNCCTVLWLLAQDPQKATDILETENVKTMLLRFYDLEKSRSKREKKTSQKEEAKVNKCKLPDLTPEWKILKRKRPRTFQDPFFAVTSLMKKLGLKKKEN